MTTERSRLGKSAAPNLSKESKQEPSQSHTILTRYIGWRKHKHADHPICYLDISMKMETASIGATLHRRWILFAGHLVPVEDTGPPKYTIIGDTELMEVRFPRRAKRKCIDFHFVATIWILDIDLFWTNICSTAVYSGRVFIPLMLPYSEYNALARTKHGWGVAAIAMDR